MSTVASSADSDDLNEKIKNRIQAIFPDPQTAQRVVNAVVPPKRPEGWGRKSNAPYYKEFYADQIKSDIDKMIQMRDAGQPQPVIYRYATFCNEESGVSKETLYNRINQSLRYLLECMDTEDKYYNKWYETVTIERVKKLGIQINWIPEFLQGKESIFKGEFVQPREAIPVWKREMRIWLESENVRPFIKDRLALTQDEVIALKTELAGLRNVQASITAGSIKIIKINVD